MYILFLTHLSSVAKVYNFLIYVLKRIYFLTLKMYQVLLNTRQVTRAMHVRNRVCPRVELILKIIILLLIIFLGIIKSKPC